MKRFCFAYTRVANAVSYIPTLTKPVRVKYNPKHVKHILLKLQAARTPNTHTILGQDRMDRAQFLPNVLAMRIYALYVSQEDEKTECDRPKADPVELDCCCRSKYQTK